MDTILITLPKKEKDRLSQLAVHYGFSVQELSSRLLREISDALPEESLDQYRNPRKLHASVRRAVDDWRSGRVNNELHESALHRRV